MANTPAHYERGKQDIREQQATFELFWWLTKVGIIVTVVLLVGLAYFFT